MPDGLRAHPRAGGPNLVDNPHGQAFCKLLADPR